MPKGEILPTAPHCQDSRFTTKGKSVLLHPLDLILITCCCREEHSLFTEAKPLGCSWKDNCKRTSTDFYSMPPTRAERRRRAEVARQQAREDRRRRRSCGSCGENSHLCLPCQCGAAHHKVCVLCLSDGYGCFYAAGFNYPHGDPTYPLDCYWSTPQVGRPDNTSRLRSGRIWYHRF